MSAIIHSSSEKWLEISEVLFTKFSDGTTSLYKALEYAKDAIAKVDAAGDVGSLQLSISYDDIDALNEKRGKLVSFANGIHYEVSQLVDQPFSEKMCRLAEKVYDLDPSDIKVGTYACPGVDFCQTLTALISSGIKDAELSADFQEKVESLDYDEPSYDLSQAMIEAKYWEKEYQKSIKCGKIADQIFTRDIRKNWDTMLPGERKVVIEAYKNEIGTILGEGSNITPERVRYDDMEGFGISSSGYITISQSFVDNPIMKYSVDKVIDTLTHEMRHQYQKQVKADPEKYGAPDNVYSDWSLPYIPPDDDKFLYLQYYSQPVEEDAKAFAALSRLYY